LYERASDTSQAKFKVSLGEASIVEELPLIVYEFITAGLYTLIPIGVEETIVPFKLVDSKVKSKEPALLNVIS